MIQTKKPRIMVALAVVYPFVIVGLMACVFLVFEDTPFEDVTLLIVFICGNLLMNALLIYSRHRTRDRWIAAEAEKWLVRRSQRSITAVRRKLLRALLWAPSAIALLIFLFFPEVCGLGSHIFRKASFGAYRLNIPLTWVIVSKSNSYLWIVASEGAARAGFSAYWHREEPVSEMTFYSSSQRRNAREEFRPPRWAEVLSERHLQGLAEKINCWDMVYFRAPRTESAEIVCQGTTSDFRANFSGFRSNVPDFYHALENATLSK